MSLIMAFTPGSPRAPARSDGAEVAGPGRPDGEPARRHKDFPEQTLMKCTSLTERVSRGRESHCLTFVCSRTSSAERESANHHSRGPRKVKPTGERRLASGGCEPPDSPHTGGFTPPARPNR